MMKVTVRLKLVMYVILVLLLIASIVFYCCARTSLAENLFVTAIGTVVSVFIIDTLISADKTNRYKAFNRSAARTVRAIVAFGIVNLRNDLGDNTNYKIDDLEKPTVELTKLFNDGLKDMVNTATNEQLNKACKGILDAVKSLDETLAKIVPYPSVNVQQLVSELRITPMVLLELNKVNGEMAEITNESNVTDQEKVIFDELKEMWKSQNLEQISRIGNSLIELHRLASKDSLQEVV